MHGTKKLSPEVDVIGAPFNGQLLLPAPASCGLVTGRPPGHSHFRSAQVFGHTQTWEFTVKKHKELAKI
jgi:hypothetical protein